jgi:hypothetical protein
VTGGQPNRVIFYITADGRLNVGVFFQVINLWLSQRAMAELFGVKTPAVSRHLKNIYESGELTPEATISKMEQFKPREEGRFLASTSSLASNRIWDTIRTLTVVRWRSVS